MTVRSSISANCREMHHRVQLVLGRQRTNAAGQFSLQCTKFLFASFGQNTNQIDHGIGRRNHRFQCFVIQRITGNNANLAHAAHRLEVFCPLCIPAERNHPHTVTRQ